MIENVSRVQDQCTTWLAAIKYEQVPTPEMVQMVVIVVDPSELREVTTEAPVLSAIEVLNEVRVIWTDNAR